MTTVEQTENTPAAETLSVQTIQAMILDGALEDARRHVLRLLAAGCREPEAYALLGEIALRQGNASRARWSLHRANEIRPRFGWRLMYADSLRASGRYEEAKIKRNLAVEEAPSTPLSLYACGRAFELDGQIDQAKRFYGEALALDPKCALALHSLARVAIGEGCLEEAFVLLETLLREAPTLAEAYIDYCSALADRGRYEEARSIAEKGIAIAPGLHGLWHNLGHILQNLDRSAEAVQVLDHALTLKPDSAATQFSRATALLKAGNFDEGWKAYEWRWRKTQKPRTDIAAALWQGEDLAGRHILVHHEQGFGDSLQFVRFVPLLCARGAIVTLQVPPTLTRLFESMEGIHKVVVALDSADRFDFHCPVASLPWRCGVTMDTIPLPPYLSVAEEEIDRQGGSVRRHMAGGAEHPDLVVGLVWAGDPRKQRIDANIVDRRRSMPLDEMAPLLSVRGVRFASFQLGDAREQLANAELPIVDVTDGILDFADTAARLYGIDLLIAVDTSIVHLAGSLNLPVWTLSRADGCWRWLENRDDTPWYPSMRIIRQATSGDWGSAVEQARKMLEQVSCAYRGILNGAALKSTEF